jgi:hypothetical protein
MNRTSVFVLMLLLLSASVFSQVSLNLYALPPDSSAMLDVQDDAKGMLIPRMTLEQISAIYRPAKGLMAYSTSDNHIYINRGSKTSPFWAMMNTEWGSAGPNIYFTGNNVGIGTSNPLSRLDVRGNAPDDGVMVRIGNSDLSHNLLLFGGRTSEPDPFIRWKPSDALRFMTEQDGGSEKMRITGDGKVGIGTSNPSANLDVAESSPGNTGIFGTPIGAYYAGTNVSIGDDNSTCVLYLGQDGSNKGFLLWNYNVDPAFAYFGLGTYGGFNKLLLQPAGGNVGIGTLWPMAKLHVEYDESNFSQIGNDDEIGNYFYHVDEGDGDGQTTVYAFRASNENDGQLYDLWWSNYAILGYSFADGQYSFGIAGYSDHGDIRTGGAFGSLETIGCWGSMGYHDSGGIPYGGYFTSSTIGQGKKDGAVKSGIGLGAWGDLMGADIHGKIYGIYTEGQNYALFAHGMVFRDDLDVHLQGTGKGGNAVLYTTVSSDAIVQTGGTVALSSGRASVTFDPVFEASVSAREPVVVTVTPVGESNGVYLSDISSDGFTIIENNNGKSSVTVNYIAMGKRSGYEDPVVPQEVIDAEYIGKIERGLHNDQNTQANGEGLYYEQGKLIVGVHPSILPDPGNSARTTLVPNKGKFPERSLKENEKGLIGN